jgi:CelD/BcsL family acetyltransferase involved in cellulose biosynthesis
MTGLTEEVNPLTDTRWSRLLSRHPSSSVFHSPEWLETLHQTYGYTPVALTTSAADGELGDGVLFCRVNTWLTGRRLVSLPFSDHCEPLVTGSGELSRLLSALERDADANSCRYLEMRPLRLSSLGECGFRQSQSVCFHMLDLSPTTSELFHAFHKDCVQRKIHRAEREHLTYEEGRSPALLRKFYRLQILTRQRQGLPPQPFAWFQNLAACMGEKLKIRVALKDGRAIASILTLQHRRTLVYKYGCSDKAFSNLGGMQMLFWQAVQEAKAEGLTEFDLGRSDWDNEGLTRFKDRLGASRSTLTYWRYPATSAVQAASSWKRKAAKRVFSCLPSACLPAMGKLLYRHMG